MARREFLTLAHVFNPEKHCIAGWWASEKLDGMRCFWDGGVTRGLDKNSVPWANTTKDERYKTQQVCTGLWSRYGNVIHAPDWWLDKLPKIPLDGELFIPEARQDLMKIVKDIEPGPGWQKVKYYVFDATPMSVILGEGQIRNTNFEKNITQAAASWYGMFATEVEWIPEFNTPFRTRFLALKRRTVENEVYILHKQEELAFSTEVAEKQIDKLCSIVMSKGGEGMIVRNPQAPYVCERSHNLLKIKKRDDAEGTVISYITGRETDKGSKLLGLMGALVLRLDNGKVLELSGFTDEERVLKCVADGEISETLAWSWASENPGKEVPEHISAKMFPRGTRVTFTYRGLTKDGIPQEAAYWRKRENE